MDIQVATEKNDGIVIFTVLEDYLNNSNAPSLKEKIFLEIADGNVKFILDLSHVKEIDSTGLGAILFGKRQAGHARGDLALFRVRASVLSIIRIAQLTHVLSIFDEKADAINYLLKK